MHIDLPDELVAKIDAVANDRSVFVAEAVRRLLREPDDVSDKSEIDLINEFADELNAEAEDVLEYQVMT